MAEKLIRRKEADYVLVGLQIFKDERVYRNVPCEQMTCGNCHLAERGFAPLRRPF